MHQVTPLQFSLNKKNIKAITLKQQLLYSVIFSLNFGIHHEQFNAVLNVIKAFKICENRPIKYLYGSNLRV